MPFSRRSSQPMDLTWSPTFQADSLPSEPPKKPKSESISGSVVSKSLQPMDIKAVG